MRYCYDGLPGRLLRGPVVVDQKLRLTDVFNGFTRRYGYDVAGRVTQVTQVTGPKSWTLAYEYYNDDAMKKAPRPWGKTLTTVGTSTAAPSG